MTKVITVQYNNGTYSQTYDFLYEGDHIEEGNLVIIPNQSNFGFTVAKVFKVKEETDHPHKATKWALNKVAVEEYVARQAKHRRIAEIKGKIRKKMEMFQSEALLKALAEDDCEAASMLSELKKLEAS